MKGIELVDQASPAQAFAGLSETSDSALVDVRTAAEWAFVGLPDISTAGRPFLTVEWVGFPSMAPNRRFYESLVEAADGRLPGTLFFICRSGVRSLAAARYVAERAGAEGRKIRCINVAEGFEGDLDSEGHRGRINGWKLAGLPWRQN